MLKIRFGADEVTVTLSGEPNTTDVISVTRRYGPGVEVEYRDGSNFWRRLAEPLKAMRAAAHLNAAVFILRGDNKKTEEQG